MIESSNLFQQEKRFDWRIAFWLLFLFLLIADQLIKLWSRHALETNQSLTLIPNVLDMSLTFNKGIAFGMFQGFGSLLAPIAIAIAVGAIYYSSKHKTESGWVHVAMSLLAAGAIGNLFDRIVLGQVTDMFRIRLFEFPIFNLADSCITVAATILIVRWGAEWVIETKSEAKPAVSLTDIANRQEPDVSKHTTLNFGPPAPSPEFRDGGQQAGDSEDDAAQNAV